MKKPTAWILFLLLIASTLVGCNRTGDPVSGDIPESAHNVVLGTLIGNYDVQFNGRTYANSRTTFAYTVSGTGTSPALSHFILEIPDCAPNLLSATPDGYVVDLDPQTGLYGVKWDTGLGIDESRDYSITFPGRVPLGVISAVVKGGAEPAIGEVPGPCAGIFDISGTVYVDADSNGVRDAQDSGIGNVTVEIDDGQTVETVLTDLNGHYLFMKTAGTYTVRVPMSTSADDFNEELYGSFTPSTMTSLSVTIGPDSPGNDVGYHPNTEELILDLETGTITTTGKPARYWQKQLRSAINGGKGNPDFPPAVMMSFILAIEDFNLQSPYQFTEGNEFQEALDILSTNSKEPFDLVLKELLAAEFNYFAGLGIEPALHEALLKYGEGLIAEGLSAPVAGPEAVSSPKRGGGPARASRTYDQRLDDGKDLYLLMNGATGGGGGTEG